MMNMFIGFELASKIFFKKKAMNEINFFINITNKITMVTNSCLTSFQKCFKRRPIFIPTFPMKITESMAMDRSFTM